MENLQEFVTDARNHDPHNFAYLVHCFINSQKSVDKVTSDYVSASLISNKSDDEFGTVEKYNTHGCWGVALDFKEEDILVAWPKDIGSRYYNREWKNIVSSLPKEKRVLSPRELLLGNNQYNEVMVKPSNVTAVVCKEFAPRFLAEKFAHARDYATVNNLPLIVIPDHTDGSKILEAVRSKNEDIYDISFPFDLLEQTT